MIRLLLLLLIGILTLSPIHGQPTGEYWLEAEISQSNPYIGETITYTVRYYAYNLDRIPVEPVIFPDFEHFWMGNVYERNPVALAIENNQYYMGEITFEIIPLIASAITIQPSELLLIETAYAPMTRYTSQAITIDVKPLPNNPPNHFTGGVGQYSISYTLDKLDATVGDSLTLKAEIISRMGNLDYFTLPALNLGDEWHVTDGKVYSTERSQFNATLQRREFEWTLIPLETGLLTIDELGFSYFDPIQAEYVELSQSPIQVNVRGESGLMIQPQLVDQLTLKTIKEPDRFSYPHWGIWVVPLGMVGLLALSKQYRLFRHKQSLIARRKNALKRALNRIHDLDNHPNEQINRRTRSIINLYLKDKAYPNIQNLPRSLEGILSLSDDLSYKPIINDGEKQAFITQFEAILTTIDDEWEQV